jgi:DEAD/DEAH box helicase domain-containing protein
LLPSVVASELEQVASDAIRTAFHPTTPGFSGLIDRFLQRRRAQVACLAHEKHALVR